MSEVFQNVFILNLIILIVVGSAPVTTKQIVVDDGILEGATFSTNSGYLFDVYYAIPYAEPPIGRLRFKAPEPAQPWEGIRDATNPGPICFQLKYENLLDFRGEEDCLQLNVYVPSSGLKNDIPVMFWVHGGGFIGGSANAYDAKYLVEKEVIVVTTNYRPGFTGFLALSNSDVPGNAGLKDLVMALEWVQRNIRHFGGNPDSVTIFGNSAGAASTHFLVMSSLTTGLFHRAIIESGASVNEWPLQKDHEQIATQLMNVIGIQSKDTYELLDYFWNIPIEHVALTVGQIPMTDGRITPFRPVLEGDYSLNAFIKKNPKLLMEIGEFNHVPTLSGYTSQEGVLFLNLINLDASTVEEMVPDFDFYLPGVLRETLSQSEKDAVKEKIKSFYFPTNTNIFEGFIDLNSDHQFIKDLDKSTKIFSKYSPDTYYYQLTYNGALNINNYVSHYKYTGAAHGDELGYLFDMLPNIQPSTQDLLVRNRMIELWTNFAKFGNPTPSPTEIVKITWKPVTEGEFNYLSIGNDLIPSTNPLQKRMQFWRDLENDKD